MRKSTTLVDDLPVTTFEYSIIYFYILNENLIFILKIHFLLKNNNKHEKRKVCLYNCLKKLYKLTINHKNIKINPELKMSTFAK